MKEGRTMTRATLSGILACAASAGVACAQDAGAQWLADLTITPDHVDVVLSLSMYSPEPWEGLAAIQFDVLNQLGADYGGITEFQILNGLDYLAGPTTINDGDSLLETLIIQAWWHFQFTPDNPIDIIAFRWEPNAGYMIADDGLPIEYDTAPFVGGFDAATWAGPNDDDETIYGIDISDSLEDVTFGWSVVPAPASTFGLLALLAVSARRGRRRA
jgi:hypothetical protein